MKKEYSAPEFEFVEFDDAAIMDNPLSASTGKTHVSTDPF